MYTYIYTSVSIYIYIYIYIERETYVHLITYSHNLSHTQINTIICCSFMIWFGRPEMSPETCTTAVIWASPTRRCLESNVSVMSSWRLGQFSHVFSLSGSNNLEDVQKEVNDVQVEIQCGKGVVINGELHFMSTP